MHLGRLTWTDHLTIDFRRRILSTLPKKPYKKKSFRYVNSSFCMSLLFSVGKVMFFNLEVNSEISK